MSDPRTGHINSTDNTVKQIKAILATAQTSWNCIVFSGTNIEDLKGMMPGLVLPAAVVRYVESQWRGGDYWRRATYEVAVICSNSSQESGGETVRGMIDSVVTAIDTQVYNSAYFYADSDSTIDMGPNKSAALIKITVEDY